MNKFFSSKMNLKSKVLTAAASGALFLSALAVPAFADTNVDIIGNGALSSSHAVVLNSNSSYVNQTNNTSVNNSVVAGANSGGNNSSWNTGGSNSTTTGSATNTVGITNAAGLNIASVPNCGCDSSTDVKIKGNGALSHNSAFVSNYNKSSLKQTNNTSFNNGVVVGANSGGNTSSFNTGPGSNTTTTGPSSNGVTIRNFAGVNIAH